MLNAFGGLTKVMIYPTCTNSLQRVAVLATLIQGLIVTGWQATQLTYKQLRHITQGTQDNLEYVQLNK